jgi:GDP-4-dehydro-6-deoxy-D-mannose reductase
LRILITGIAGFVGKHLTRYLLEDGNNEILGADLKSANFSTDKFGADGAQNKIKVLEVDIEDKKSVENIIVKFKPQQIYHLAAQSSVNFSWENPVETFRANVFGGINILESLKNYCPGCRILVVCTAEEYSGANDKKKAIDEDFKIYPSNPYAISKAALDFFSITYHRAYGIPVLVSRSFNHIGPGQSERFVCSDFAKQIAEIENGTREPVVKVGNIEAYRDFLDVRDVVKAYSHIINRGKIGQAYNVCSGKKYKISYLLDVLMSISRRNDITIKVDKDKFRPVDTDIVYGNNSKLRSHTGWKPEYSITDSLRSVLEYWREEIGKELN